MPPVRAPGTVCLGVRARCTGWAGVVVNKEDTIVGNRAVIAFGSGKSDKEFSPAIYLHWNGGRDSVEAFLAVAKKFDLRCDDYGCARLAQIIGNWIGGGLGIGVGCYGAMDTNNHDNGVYWVQGWEIVRREYHKGSVYEQQNHDHDEIVQEILEANASIPFIYSVRV